jgi:HEXXH motif-containing protein
VNSVADAVFAALDRPGEPWLPGLASLLVANSAPWRDFDEGRAYGTARWVAGDPASSRHVAGKITIARHEALVEILPEVLAERFGHLAPARSVGPEALATVRDAATLLSDVPSLAESTGSLVRALHVLHADTGYDVSHSEPTIPLSIFVSVPSPGEKDAVIRVAESMVHEAMHLQLTLMEAVLPLVAIEGEGFSPWQRRTRPVRGLLHGLYVFSAIVRFMDHTAGSRPELGPRARQRRREIGEELASLEDFSPHLTAGGKALRVRCLLAAEGVGASSLGAHISR